MKKTTSSKSFKSDSKIKRKLKSISKQKLHPRPLKPKALPFIRFMGISLGGGKSDRTVLTIIDYYLLHKKLVVSRVIDHLSTEGEISSDHKLFETIQEYKNHLKLIAFDVPLSLPKCFRCELNCPGYEVCDEEEIIWMWKQHRQNLKNNKNQRLFTPYTRRCVEEYWSKELVGAWSLSDAMGSNQAPLLARARFITRRMRPQWKSKIIEVLPRLSLLRWSSKQKLLKHVVNGSRSSVEGIESREYVLKKLTEDLDLFIYEQDKALILDSLVAFDSLWSALSAFWKFQKKCEIRPKSFPKHEGWIDVPRF